MSTDHLLQRRQHEAPQRERHQQSRAGHADARAAQFASPPGDRPTRLCYACGKPGHIAAECSEPHAASPNQRAPYNKPPGGGRQAGGRPSGGGATSFLIPASPKGSTSRGKGCVAHIVYGSLAADAVAAAADAKRAADVDMGLPELLRGDGSDSDMEEELDPVLVARNAQHMATCLSLERASLERARVEGQERNADMARARAEYEAQDAVVSARRVDMAHALRATAETPKLGEVDADEEDWQYVAPLDYGAASTSSQAQGLRQPGRA
jgi:hypothetical protein